MTLPPLKEILGLRDLADPQLYERGQPVRNSPYAGEIRKALNELNLAAIFCIEGVPQIAILEQVKYDKSQVSEVHAVHAALWNQGLASILVVMDEDVVRVFSLAKMPKAPEDKYPEWFDEQCLIKTLEAADVAISLKNYIYGAESGRLWHEKSKYFDPRERIDSILLKNLTFAHGLLVDTGLSDEGAQAILIQTMFIAYLEDRGITTPSFFKNVSKGEKDSLSGILASGSNELLERLFEQLRRNFNGDLFVAPCSFDDSAHPQRLGVEAMKVLHRFRDGREEMSDGNGQLRFWGYNFKFIPVELISAVYDRFLSYDEGARHASSAYYTPMFLVDTVISSVWENIDDRAKSQGSALDPACGSGIFLVRTFQRFCEHWRQNAKGNTIRWDSLVKILRRLQGRDINGVAVRVAVFSLYIALLEEVSPPDIEKIAKEGKHLPSLWKQTLVKGDFFDEELGMPKVDMVVGNPPWASRRNVTNSGVTWCASRSLPMPSRDASWAFAWKTLEHLTSQGTAAFLLPAMGFLHDHAKTSVDARKRFFKETRVHKVINFADLRLQLFDSATHPTTLVVFQRDDTTTNYRDYKFNYWTPKADLNLAIKRFITLSTTDKSIISLSNVDKNPFVFKQRLWMRSPDAKLFNYLHNMPKIGPLVKEFGSSRGNGGHADRPWMIGQGFQPYNGPGTSLRTKKPHESKIVAGYKHLPTSALTPVSVNLSRLEPFHQSAVRSKGFEDGFVAGTRVLVSRGIATSSMRRLRAAYVEEPVTFRDTIQAIIAPNEEKERAKFITAFLNSRLAVWYSFHGTASFGAYRPEVKQAELLKLPMPDPEDLASPEKARSIRKKMVDIVSRHYENREKVLRSQDEEKRLLRKIDLLTYAYFGLSDKEIILIEDTVEHILPAIQPSASSFPNLWKTTTRREREAYANQLIASLSDWLDDKRRLSVRLIAFNADFGILRLRLHDTINASEDAYAESENTSLSEALGNISKSLKKPIESNFRTMLDLRIFVGDNLFLIKPMQRRFWLRSTALTDVDSIASELETNIATGMIRSAIS